jgi:AI-2 transport protein TqsA
MDNENLREIESKKLTLQIIFMPILVLAAATALLYFAGPILIPIVLAATLTYLLLPVVELIKKLKVPHWLAVMIVMIVVVAIFALLFYYAVNEIADLASTLPQYMNQIESTLQNWNVKISDFIERLPTFLKPSNGNLGVDSGRFQSLGGFLLKGVHSITSFIFGVVLIFFLVLFMLLESDLFTRKFRTMFGGARAEETKKIINEINAQIKGYIQVRFYVFVGLSIVITVGLLIMNVQYAYIWGPLAGLLNIIPYIGAVIGAVPAVIIAGIQHHSILYMIYVALFFLVIQTIEGNYITPELTKTSVDLNAVTALVSLLYWGWIWGGIGLFLGVPITAAIKVICDHIEPLKPIGILLGRERTKHQPEILATEEEES